MSSHDSFALRSPRGLAITLPLLTFVLHAVSILVALPVPYSDHVAPFHPTLWFSLYSICAASASLVGLIGAVKMNPTMVFAYTTVYSASLLFGTLTLLTILLPFDLQPFVPLVPRLEFDVSGTCKDLTIGQGWNEGWAELCEKRFGSLKYGVVYGGLVLMAAQGWALGNIWWDLKERNRSDGWRTDVEKRHIEEKCESKGSQDPRS